MSSRGSWFIPESTCLQGRHEIDSAKQEAALNTAKENLAAKRADLVLARRQYQRTRSLSKAGVVSREALDQAKAALDAAKSQVEALQEQVRQESVQLR